LKYNKLVTIGLPGRGRERSLTLIDVCDKLGMFRREKKVKKGGLQ
jgi:hypothetical protein